MRLLGGALILALSATPALGQDCEARRDLQLVNGQVAGACVMREATKRVRSRLSPGRVAMVALGNCRTQIDRIRGSCGGDALAATFRQRFRHEATAMVVSERGRRRRND